MNRIAVIFWVLIWFNQVNGQQTYTQEEMNNLRLLQEKVYIQTDKPYYYPKETIWLKAYVQNFYPALKDSLSKLLYVELIASDYTVIRSLNLMIESGVATGSIHLPDSTKPGEYVLRAYTQWMRNYGDSYIFHKPLVVFNFDENIDPETDPKKKFPQPFEVKIKTNKSVYSSREKVAAELVIHDKNGNIIQANLAVSVTDAEVIIPLIDDRVITDGALAFNHEMDKVNLLYPIERGITVRGRVLFNKIRSFKVNMVQGNGALTTVETTDEGYFAITDMSFYDSLSVAIQAVNENGKRVGRIKILEGDNLPVKYEFRERNYVKRKDNMIQRVQNTYSIDSSVRMLEEVIIEGQRSVTDSIVQARMKLYNKADYTVKGNQLTNVGGNILLSLQGKVPGVRVQEYYDEFNLPRVRVTIRGGMSSFSGNSEPLYLVDGVLFNDANSLLALSPDLIDRVEIVTRAVPQYGSRGTNGVIAFYTKNGLGNTGFTDPNFERFWVKGFQQPEDFPMPNYDLDVKLEHDFRSTLYWNPNLNLVDKPLTFTFFTADLPGRYRIVLEGITSKNIPIHYEHFIEVE